jgi:glycosyltransferase involved in cell wall biosynthesis
MELTLADRPIGRLAARTHRLRREPPPIAVRSRVDRLHFVHLSFEGPDRYSRAGGLAERVTNLTRALAQDGHRVDLYFVGDPDRPGVELSGGVTLHRWCQAISAAARDGVYDAEERKIEDFCRWFPSHVADVVAADRAEDRRTVVLAEDWHTAWPLIAVHDELVRRNLREWAVLAWTANNRFGFDRIDFARLASASTLLTISRAMKHLMWGHGVNPLVVPNGIPNSLLTQPADGGRGTLRTVLGQRVALSKVGRWDPDKRWSMAIDAVAHLRDRGESAVLLARGWNGTTAATAHYRDLRAHADRLGLPWSITASADPGHWGLVDAVRRAMPAGAGIVELAFPIDGATLQMLYEESDAVLANSGFEPFGLVGLEAMAARGIVIAGSTGEDYVIPFRNGFALDTDDAAEIVRCLDWLRREPGRERAMRGAAYETAGRSRWADVIERLFLALGVDDLD